MPSVNAALPLSPPTFSNGSTAIDRVAAAVAPGPDPRPAPRESANAAAASTTTPIPAIAQLGTRRRELFAGETAATGAVAVGVIPPLGVASGSSCASISSALCHRSAGRFSSAFMITFVSAPRATAGDCSGARAPA